MIPLIYRTVTTMAIVFHMECKNMVLQSEAVLSLMIPKAIPRTNMVAIP
jgi:hypothetical protein